MNKASKLIEDFNSLYTDEDLTNHLGVSAIIRDPDGSILLQDHVKYDFWTIPIGKVKAGEDLEKGLIKELKEELNITATQLKLLHKFTEVYNRNNKKVTVESHIYEVISYTGKIINREPVKNRSLRFMKLSEIKSLSSISDNTKEMLKLFSSGALH